MKKLTMWNALINVRNMAIWLGYFPLRLFVKKPRIIIRSAIVENPAALLRRLAELSELKISWMLSVESFEKKIEGDLYEKMLATLKENESLIFRIKNGGS